MPINDNFMLKELQGEYMIIPLSGGGVDMTKTFNINETGAFIYKALEMGKTVDEVVDLMAEEYNAPKDVLKNDVLEFVSILKEKGIYNE